LDQNPIDYPVHRERQRDDADDRPQRAHLRGREEPERAERARDDHLAIGQIHHAGDAVLQLQSHRDQRVGAAKQQANDENAHLRTQVRIGTSPPHV
jgi:hypothetical protein